MRKIFLIILVLNVVTSQLYAQISGSFIVRGNVNNFYPVTFYDGGNDNNDVTVLTLGRSSVHIDTIWRGSCIGSFRFHTYNWGYSNQFIDADIKQFSAVYGGSPIRFIAGWQDVTGANGDKKIIIWLKGGGTTYYYHSNYTVSPTVYDGSANALPYQETNGPTYTYKTALDSYVNNAGISNSYTAYFNGSGVNYFNGNVGIGTLNPQGRLAVNGYIYSKKVIVTQLGWSDYVFYRGYRLHPLPEVEKYIKQRRHLPDVPSAADVEKDGIDLGDCQATLLRKIEELTLYVIELNKKCAQEDKQLQLLKKELHQFKNRKFLSL